MTFSIAQLGRQTQAQLFGVFIAPWRADSKNIYLHLEVQKNGSTVRAASIKMSESQTKAGNQEN